MDFIHDTIDMLRSRRVLAGAFAGGMCGLLLIVFVVVPRTSSALEAYRTMQEMESRIEAARQWEPRLAQLQAEEARLVEQLDSLFVAQPENDRISTILGLLRDAAEHTGVTLQRVEPAAVIRHDTYEELPIEIAVRGTFHPVARFVDRLERSRYLITVRGVTLDTQAVMEYEIQARLRLHLITLRGRNEED